ncbi:hypothetical protein [Deinococcus sp.]|uniref:hypothetical protein n=1 Tax=Deinococcus sp. TaxID=47478 RepID=UPI003C7D3021
MAGSKYLTFGKTTLLRGSVIGVGIEKDRPGATLQASVVIYTLAGPIRIGSYLNDIGAERLYTAALAEIMNPELSTTP